MKESMIDIIKRLELEIESLKKDVSTFKNSTKKESKIDLTSEIKSVVTLDYVNYLYRGNK